MQEFSKPTFEGARFEEHSLPLEATEDLLAYERLIKELAKHLYLQDHPNRKRVPKGFDTEFHLHLEKLEPGSTMPVLSLLAAGTLALSGSSDYFVKARDVVAECIAAAPDQLPREFPKHLLKSFNTIGKSLKDDESLNLTTQGGSTAKLTSTRRKSLVLAANQVYEKEISMEGHLDAPNFERGQFLLRHENGNSTTCPLPEDFHDDVRRIVGIDRHRLAIKGTGAFDAWDQLKRVLEINELEVQLNYQISQKLESFLLLKAGWCGEGSLAFDEENLNQFADLLTSHFPDKLTLPSIIPTQEANILLEWSCPGHPSIDIDLTALSAELHAFAPDESDIEEEYDLNESGSWNRMINQIQQLGC